MPELNLIKVKQIDSSVWQYVSGLISGGFGSALNQYLNNGGSLGVNLVYTSNLNQSISGKKTFLVSPAVPYSGASGDAPSRAYIDNAVSALSTSLAPLVSSQFLYATGNRLISGNTYIVGNIYSNVINNSGSNSSINIAGSFLQDSTSTQTLNWNTKQLFGNWTVDGHSFVYADTNQSIQGIKTFVTEVVVPTASNPYNPVTYNQFQTALGSSGQYFNDLFNSISTSSASGFGGILSLNGQSGNIFTQGRGTVTVYQQGNILSISGAQITRQSGDSIFKTYTLGLPSGVFSYRVNFSVPTVGVPTIFSQLVNPSGDLALASLISGVDSSGFSVAFSNKLPTSNYQLSYLSLDNSGIINLLQGSQGLIGPYMQGKGIWNSGQTYAFLNFVRTSDGVAWYAKSGHLSTSDNAPSSSGGASFWDILSSGSGPKGDNAVPFTFQGVWDGSKNYTSGQAVIFNGASYATLSGVSTGISPGNSPWFVVAAQGGSGAGFRYKDSWNPNILYTGGDVVSFGLGSYFCPADTTISGINFGPLSLNSQFSTFVPRTIQYRAGYSATQIYYNSDIASTSSGFNLGESVQYINTESVPLYSLHPYGYYNQFNDCDGFTGYNLIQLTTGIKDQYHPYFGKGNSNGFLVNNISINTLGSGFGTLVLIRGKSYYFDSELSACPFIFTTNPSGGSYNGQVINGVVTGNRLSVNPANYVAPGFNQAIASGSLIFTPSASTPDTMYYQSPVNAYMGWKIKVVDNNPWKIFSSGQKGDSIVGPQGVMGNPGLAFNWRGTWNGALGYNSGDSIFFNGSSYATSSATIGNQPPTSPWFLVASKGESGANARGLAFVWQGNWSQYTAYNPNDSVYYNGTSYATSGVVSGNFPPNLYSNYWFPVAQGSSGIQGLQGAPGLAFTWRGPYNHSTYYSSGDAVFYKGNSYGSISPFSTFGVDPDDVNLPGFWNLIAQQGGTIFSWRGNWSSATNYYSGDSVFYNGSSFGTQSSSLNSIPSTDPSSSWFLVAQGASGVQGPQGDIGPKGTGGLAFEWRGTWDGTQNYYPKDSVFWNGSSYGTLSSTSGGATPPDLSSKWFTIAKQGNPGLAFNWKGTWSSTSLYSPYDSVFYQGRSYGTINYVAATVTPPQYSGDANWFVVADRGSRDFFESIYLAGNLNSGVGVNFGQKFIGGGQVGLTGFMIGLDTTGFSGPGLTGTIFSKSVATNPNQQFPLATFVIRTGQFYITSGLNNTVSYSDRIGVSLAGSLSGASGMTIGFLGYYYA